MSDGLRAVYALCRGNGRQTPVGALVRDWDPDASDACGNRALHVACLYNHAELARALLAAGACAEAYNCRYEQPVDVAVRAHADEAFAVLWGAGARTPTAIRRVLLTAVRERAPHIAAQVLARCEPAARPDLAAEAALLAARTGSPAVLELIVAAHPACASARDRGGRTALHLACEHRDPHTVEATLRTCGAAALQWTDGAGLLPLHSAARAGCPRCVRVLLDAGADPRFATTMGHGTAALAMGATAPFADVQHCIAALAAVATPAERDDLLVSAVLSGKLHVVEHVVASLGIARSGRVAAGVAAIRHHFYDALDCLVRPAEARADGPCLMAVAARLGRSDAMVRLDRLGWRASAGSPQVVHACIDGGPAVVDYAHRIGLLGSDAAVAAALRGSDRGRWDTGWGRSALLELLWLGYDVLAMAPAWNAAAARAHRRGRATVACEQRLALARAWRELPWALDLWVLVAGALPARAPLTAYGRLPARGAIGRARFGGSAREPPVHRIEPARTRPQEDACAVY